MIVFIVGISAVLSVPIYFLWNWLCPELFGLPTISYGQALGLSYLSSFLIKSNNVTTNKK